MSMKLTLLGTGTSHGVPMIACGCEVCRSEDPRDKRTRTSAVVHGPGGNILIDAGPELRLQCVRSGIERIESILFTHAHADHIFGLDDVRRFNDVKRGVLPCYMNGPCRERLEKVFSYCLSPPHAAPPYARPHLSLVEVHGPFETAGMNVVPLPLMHGDLEVLGFRFDGLAYCTDCKVIPDDSLRRLHDLEVLVLDALRPQPHPTHLNIDEAVEMVERLKPGRAYFVHMTHGVSHAALSARLPRGMEPAYDGQVIEWG